MNAVFRIWKNNELVAEVELTNDDTLTVAQDGDLEPDTDLVGVTAEGDVVQWDENE
jgi:hypothetical protein